MLNGFARNSRKTMTEEALNPKPSRIQCLATEEGEEQSPNYEIDTFIEAIAEIALSVARRQGETQDQ